MRIVNDIGILYFGRRGAQTQLKKVLQIAKFLVRRTQRRLGSNLVCHFQFGKRNSVSCSCDKGFNLRRQP